MIAKSIEKVSSAKVISRTNSNAAVSGKISDAAREIELLSERYKISVSYIYLTLYRYLSDLFIYTNS